MTRAVAVIAVAAVTGLVLAAAIFWVGIEIIDGHEDLSA